MEIIRDMVSNNKYSIKCPYSMTPTSVTVHNTANDASAKNEITYMKRNEYKVSFHYAVDDKEVRQGIEENRNAWHAGDGGKGKGNRTSIAIEICYSKSGGDRFIKAEQKGAELVAYILKKYGWGIDRVKKHQDWSGKYCLPMDETEVLTKQGWVPIGDVEVGDVIAQYNEGRIEFEKVIDTVEPYIDKVVKVAKTEATEDHDMLQLTVDGYHHKIKWGDMINKSLVYIPVGGKYETEGLDISDDYLRFLVWLQADGSYMLRQGVNGVNYIGIEFHFSKQRKIDRVVGILDDIGQKYTIRTKKDGTTVIRIFDSTIRERTEKWLDNKNFSWKFIEMSNKQRGIFLKEITMADGSVTNNSYFASEQQNYDVVSAVASLHNQRNLQTTTGNSTALIMAKSRMSFSKNMQRQQREALVTCVSVPSGAILIRQYGQPKVVGNCPHRTLDMGWSRFLKMVDKYLNPDTWKDKCVKLEETSYQAKKKTDLVYIDSGKIVKSFGKGEQIDVAYKYEDYYITQYSFDRNIKNGVKVVDWELVKEPEPEPTIPPEVPEPIPNCDEIQEKYNQILNENEDLRLSVESLNKELAGRIKELNELKNKKCILDKFIDDLFNLIFGKSK